MSLSFFIGALIGCILVAIFTPKLRKLIAKIKRSLLISEAKDKGYNLGRAYGENNANPSSFHIYYKNPYVTDYLRDAYEAGFHEGTEKGLANAAVIKLNLEAAQR